MQQENSSNTSIPKEDQAQELPTFNPPQVRVITDSYEAAHGLQKGTVVRTIRPEINVRDNNGFDVWVNSPTQNCPIWLNSLQYELLTDKAQEVANG